MSPVQYSEEAKVIVSAFESLPGADQSGNYWGDDAVDMVRAEIKNHCIADQNYICVYCKRQIVTGNNALWDAEHIISKALAPRFMFTPLNLAVSCRDCNIAKGQKEVRTTMRKKFPNESKHYFIIHPHLDNYTDHIRWFGDVCSPLSPKGVATQAACGLTRFTAELLGIDGVLVHPGFDKHVGDLLKAKSKLDAEAAIAAIKVYVAAIPQE